MSSSNRPTRAELLTALGIFAAAGAVACLAAALADPSTSDLVWWLFFAASLMTGFSRATTRK
ncbi:hypothetical protein [Kitasatospora sp. NPDC093806]|uniref:hypothetical protein n=1 Tax=Kitasatospora sp. NPDC093806 TaxID=3155075 RepID=UPI00341A5E6B